jgi:hypothetical protein
MSSEPIRIIEMLEAAKARGGEEACRQFMAEYSAAVLWVYVSGDARAEKALGMLIVAAQLDEANVQAALAATLRDAGHV